MRNVLLTEKQFRYILKESISELKGYHGTSADFDKFNHKKFLNTGCGSQSFGWGTYITDDETIGKSYADLSGNPENEIEGKEVQKPLDIVPYIKDFLVSQGYKDNSVGDAGNDGTTVFLFATKIYSFLSKGYTPKETREAFQSRYDSIMMDYKDGLELYGGELPEKTREYYEKMSKFFACLLKCMDILEQKGLRPCKAKKILYEVEIPDDNGSNYFEWYGFFPPQFMKRVLWGLKNLKPSILQWIAKKNYMFRSNMYYHLTCPNFEKMTDLITQDGKYMQFFDSSDKEALGKNVYAQLRKWFESAKAASLFLMMCGFDGIKYPAGTRWELPDGASEDAQNYVIFDANKVKIINKTDRTNSSDRNIKS